MYTRREFLTASSLVALAPTVPVFLRQSALAANSRPDERILVVIQLTGGNDGLNTVVPFADEAYTKNRRRLRISEDRLIKLNDSVGLHPSMRDAADLFQEQRLAIVQGVGYPNPNRSHDVSMAIWHTARLDREEHGSYGWIGRALDELPIPDRNAPSSILVGHNQAPVSLRGRKCLSSSFSSLDDLHARVKTVPMSALSSREVTADLTTFVTRATLDAYATADVLKNLASANSDSRVTYPSSDLGGRMKLIARLIKAGLGTRVYYTLQGGYDTHSGQLNQHATLLRSFSQSLKSFLDDLAAAKLEERVLVLCFSEFGRQVKENASAGTDHGTAGPVFLAGSSLSGGLHGAPPNLLDLEGNAPHHTTDFRTVYATIAEEWLDVHVRQLLKEDFSRVRLFG